MKVISWNILHGQPLSPPTAPPSPEVAHSSLHKVSTQLSSIGCEILGIQEVDDRQVRSGDISQTTAIAKARGATHWAYAPTLIGTPGEKWRALNSSDEGICVGRENAVSASQSKSTSGPSEPREPSEPSYGVGLISKIPVTAWHRLDLGRSRIGLPLAIPAGDGSQRSLRFIYVRDEPRVALAAELENGFTVVVTHLSFVPFVNYFQLIKIRRWLRNIPGVHILLGDLNLGWSLPVRGTHWRSLVEKNTYPSWGAKIQFDYITAHIPHFGERSVSVLDIPDLGISDHLPIGVEIH